MFPYYLNCGMTYDLYWNGDPTLVEYYRQAYEMNIQRRNEELWLQGLYNFNAISTALSNIHFDGKFHKPNKYLEKPIDLFEERDEQAKKEKVRQERQKIIDKLNAWKSAWDSKKG